MPHPGSTTAQVGRHVWKWPEANLRHAPINVCSRCKSRHHDLTASRPLLTDIVAKRFLVPERGIIFQERVRIENIDSRIPSFGFCYCLLQRVDGSLADFCNTIDPQRTFSTLFDHLVGGHLHDHGHREAERLRRLEVDHELEFGGLAPSVPDRVSCVNAGHGADAPVPSICWPYKRSAPLSRAQEHLLLSFYTLPPSADTVACICGR
jgi:hypothetical protein